MTSGREGEIHAGVPDSEFVVFEENSHYPFAEEPGRFLATLDDFLTAWRAGLARSPRPRLDVLPIPGLVRASCYRVGP